MDSFPQTYIIRALRRRKHTGAHRRWRTRKLPPCPSSSTLSSVHTRSNKVKKLQLLTGAHDESTGSPSKLWWHSGAAGVCADSGGLRCTHRQENKREGMYVLISRTSGAQSRLLNHNSASSCWKRFCFFFLCKPFCSLWEFASIIFFAAVYTSPQAKANDMPCLLSGQIIKMKTKHPDSAVFIQGNTGKNTEYRWFSVTPPFKGSFPSFCNTLHGCYSRPGWIWRTNAGGRQTYLNLVQK